MLDSYLEGESNIDGFKLRVNGHEKIPVSEFIVDSFLNSLSLQFTVCYLHITYSNKSYQYISIIDNNLNIPDGP